jgi:hypothetical protein
MKFDGTSWVNVGSAGFSAGIVFDTRLAFSPSGKPYVAYQDFQFYTFEATVMMFTGASWVTLGLACFSAGDVDGISLAFGPSGQPYVAYEDEGNSNKATVMKFNGTTWVNVGSAGFSAGEAYYTSLAFSPSGQPYVAYEDNGNSDKATVMKFNGTNWVDVGTAGFSAGKANYTSLAFSPSDDQPSVIFQDWTNSKTATVMKYDSIYVGINEQKESKLSLYPNPSTNKITLEISGETTESNLSIVNIEGQQLIARLITEPITQLDISTLPYGVYFVRLTGEKTVQVGKIVKN